MAIAQVKKIQILGHKSDQAEVLACLQDAGLVEVTKATEALLPEQSPVEKLADLDNRLRSLKEAIDGLGLYAAAQTPFLKSFLKARPIVEPDEIEAAVKTDTYQPILAEIKGKEAEIKRLENQAKRLTADLESLRLWVNLDLTVQDLSGSAHTRFFLGTVNQPDYAEFLREVKDKGFPVFLETVNRTKRERHVVVICLIEHKEEVEQILRRHNFHLFALPESAKGEDALRLTVKQTLGFLEEKRKCAQGEITTTTGEMAALIPQRILLMGLYDHFFNLRSRLLAVPRLGSTRQVFLMEGWIRAGDMADLKIRLQKFSALAIFSRKAFIWSTCAPAGAAARNITENIIFLFRPNIRKSLLNNSIKMKTGMINL